MDAATTIERLIGTELFEIGDVRNSTKPVVALAYDEGSGGLEIAQALARRLSVKLYDKQLMDAIASASGIAPAMLERLDDRYRSHWTDWLQAFKAELAVAQIQYFRHLTNIVLAIANSGGIIVGRGAYLILAHHPAYRVRIVGSPEYCAKRMVNTLGLSYAEALAARERSHREKARFIEQYFHRTYNDPMLFDLVLNSDKLSSVERGADIVAHALRQTGYGS